ncbi:hypothetical protein V6Z11_A07G140100 [Gossypium hirsutum]
MKLFLLLPSSPADTSIRFSHLVNPFLIFGICRNFHFQGITFNDNRLPTPFYPYLNCFLACYCFSSKS